MFFFFQAEDGIRDDLVTGVQTCALPIFGHDRGIALDRGSQDVNWVGRRAERPGKPADTEEQELAVPRARQLQLKLCGAVWGAEARRLHSPKHLAEIRIGGARLSRDYGHIGDAEIGRASCRE